LKINEDKDEDSFQKIVELEIKRRDELVRRKKLKKYYVIFEYDLKTADLHYIYKLRDMGKDRFIGCWKTFWGSGMFTYFLIFEKCKNIKKIDFGPPYYSNRRIPTYYAYNPRGAKNLYIHDIKFDKLVDLTLMTLILSGYSEADILKQTYFNKSIEEVGCNFCDNKGDFYFYYSCDEDEEYEPECMDLYEPFEDMKYDELIVKKNLELENISEGDTLHFGCYKFLYMSVICSECLWKLKYIMENYRVQIFGIIPREHEISDRSLKKMLYNQKIRYSWENNVENKRNRNCDYCNKKKRELDILFLKKRDKNVYHSKVCLDCINKMKNENELELMIAYPKNCKWYGRI